MIELIVIMLVIVGIILILRSIYFTYEANDLIEFLLISELGNLSNEFMIYSKKIYASGILGKNYSYGDMIKSMLINVVYNVRDKKTKEISKIHSQIMVCEFDNMYFSFFKYTFDLFSNLLKKQKKYIFFEIIRDGKYRAFLNKDCMFIPYSFSHEKVYNKTFYFENPLLFLKFKEKLLENYRLNKSIGKAVTIENNVDKILSNAEEIQIKKTGNI